MRKLAVANQLREKYMGVLREALLAKDADLDLLQVASNEYAIPVVDSEGEEAYVVLKVSVPKEDYDGYLAEKDYADKVAEKAQKKAEAEAKKAEKARLAAAKKAQKAQKEGE